MFLPRILVIKAGSTDPEVADQYGDYDDWFAVGLEDGVNRLDVVEAHAGETLPRPEGYGGILITGSPLSVRDQAPWMPAMARWALRVADFGTPLLCVCFGHQLVGELLGGRAERDPAGGEFGAVTVALTPEGQADPLFEGLPAEITVLTTHEDALVRAPTAAGVVRLAGNAATPWQAYAAGANVRAVQFHPELWRDPLAALLARRGLRRELPAQHHGARILANWDRAFVRRSLNA